MNFNIKIAAGLIAESVTLTSARSSSNIATGTPIFVSTFDATFDATLFEHRLMEDSTHHAIVELVNAH